MIHSTQSCVSDGPALHRIIRKEQSNENGPRQRGSNDDPLSADYSTMTSFHIVDVHCSLRSIYSAESSHETNLALSIDNREVTGGMELR